MDEIQIDSISPDSGTAVAPTRNLEELSLLEMIWLLIRHPFSSFGALATTLARPSSLVEKERFYVAEVEEDAFDVRLWLEQLWSNIRPLLGMLIALAIAVFGSFLLVSSSGDPTDTSLKLGLLFVIIGAVIMIVVTARNIQIDRLPPLTFGVSPLPMQSSEPFLNRYGLRIALFLVSLLWALGTWLFTANNDFSALGMFCWVMSILTMAAALLNRNIYVGRWFRDRWVEFRDFIQRGFSIRFNWTLFALVIILILGAILRFNNLANIPPDMTSDHVEKLLDAKKIYDGARPIFLPNNGGREVFQMYLIAFIKTVTGLPFTFELLKLVSGLEGMVMILVAYWMGRTIFGEEDRQLGNLVGLIMAALVATSFWHILLSRLALRIALTPIVVAIVLIFLARGLRYNRRGDFIIAGLLLGAGVYTYQAIRMLPLVPVVGIVLALLLRANNWKSRREYVTNFLALVIMAVVVFIPLWHYMTENGPEFWNRTTGRIFGDAVRETDTGAQIPVPWPERLQAFRDNLPVLGDNMVRSLLMFNWKGDRSWFNGSPDGNPALDYFTGAVFILGLGIILLRIVKRRDPTDLLLLVAIVIMVLPSALAIAFTIEVPGFTRASGSLPMVYLIASLALAIIIRLIAEKTTLRWVRNLLYTGLIVLVLIGVYANYTSYFVSAMGDYRQSTLPHRQAGRILRGFIDSTGAPGNAFIVAYRYWWDHRAVAIESGDPQWANTLPGSDGLDSYLNTMIQSNQGGRYALRTDRQLLFFIHQEDTVAPKMLMSMFPTGQLMKIPSYNTTRDFFIYVAPPVGCEWAQRNTNGVFRECVEATPTNVPPGS